MNVLYLELSEEPKLNFSFYMTPHNRQVAMTKFRLENLAPELLPLGAKLNYDYQTACSCAWYYGLEAYYEVFGLSSVKVVMNFEFSNILEDWRQVSIPRHLLYLP
jgi:hypothetical protein